MYRVNFNGYPLHDLRDKRLILRDPFVRLAVGNAGAMSFIIDDQHPYASRITRLTGVLELWNDRMRIFRGRVTTDTRDFYLNRTIEAEGLLACLNDSIIPPFNFPEDFENDAGYQAAAANGNVIEFFLGWLLDQHNVQVGAAQKIQLGTVTVSDPNNYITRSSSEYLTTMEVVQKKLEELLGGYLLADYSGDTTVLHYYDDLPLTNVQEVEFGENLLDLVSTLDSADTYTAILPIGKDGLTVADLPDGEFSPGIFKEGLILYSQEAEETLGGRITKTHKWDDVTEGTNLRRKAADLLTGEGITTAQTITVRAADMGSLKDLPRFVVGRYVRLNSTPHGFSAAYPLMELKPDILDPGNTTIVMGRTTKTATDMSHGNQSATQEKLDQTQKNLMDSLKGVETNLNKRIDGIEGIDGVYFYVRYSANADGSGMTTAPTDGTRYMGTCSTNQATAPTDPKAYTWCIVRGADGKDGKDGKDGTNGTPGQPGGDGVSSYFHVKYSNDGKTFTSNNGETLGDWMGTRVDYVAEDSLVFADYTWKKIVGEDGKDGIDGEDGTDGVSTYFFVKFSANANGNPMTETPASNTKYMGVCSTTSATAPTSPSAYTWTQCRGEDGTNGTPGEKGADGRTQYLHIKYSNDGETFTPNNGEDLGAWIGTLVDFTEKDSLNFSDYTWKRFTEDVEEELDEMRQTFTEQITSAVQNTESVIFSALTRYVETSNFEDFQQTIESELKVMADNITLKFTEATQLTQDVNGDLQQTNANLSKYFEFTADGVAIKAGEGTMTLRLDNDLIIFEKDGQQFGHWNGVDFYTGNIIIEVNERAQFGNFAAVPRSSGNLSWMKVRG